LRWMVLPLNECPAAPAQGALAIECRSGDEDTLAMLHQLHCDRTAAEITSERQILDDWGGGCHQRFGATQISIDPLGALLYIRGRKPDNSPVEETRWQPQQTLGALSAPAWDGTVWRQAATVADVPVTAEPPHWLPTSGALFLAHSRALPTAWVAQLSGGPQRVWTSGTASWFRLAGQGIWVEGCAEELGYQTIQSLVEEPVLGLPAAQNWRILTHSQAVNGWPQEEVIATYTLQAEVELTQEHPAVIELSRASSVFWSSTSQYELFEHWVPEQCEHACRYGKTYYSLADKGLGGLTAYPNAAEWHRHLEANKQLAGRAAE
jgi:hydroxymethylbilane synthase